MPCRYAKYFLLLFLLTQSVFIFAQGDDLTSKLNSFKAQNDLSNWIYEQLDYANQSPEKASVLLKTVVKNRWRAAATDDERFAWLNLLSTLGYYQLLDGDIIGSINTYESAFTFFQKYKILSYDIVEYTLKPLSNNYTRLGDYERALYIQQQSINFQRLYQEDTEKIANIYGNIAISYRSMEKLSEAKKAINVGLALKPGKASLIILNNVYADILCDEGRYEWAVEVISTSLKQQAQLNAATAYWLMSSHTTAGNIQRAQQQLYKAQQSYQKALAILKQFFPYGRTREKANLFTQLGKVALQQKQPKLALNYFNQTLATLGITNLLGNVIEKNIYGDNKLMEVFLQIAETHSLLKNEQEALKNLNLSLLAADKIRDEFADDKTKERLQRNLKNIAEQGIEMSYNLFQRTKKTSYLAQILVLAEQSKSRTLLDQMQRNRSALAKSSTKDSLFAKKAALERAIVYQQKQSIENKNLSLTISGLKFELALVDKEIVKKYQHLNLNELADQVSLSNLPNHRIIEFFVGEKHIYIININQQKIATVVRLKDAIQLKASIKNFVGTYFQRGPYAMINDPKSFYEASHQIYRSIFASINIAPHETLTVIPDGILGYLSFDGLITAPTYVENIAHWPFFIKQYQTNYAFSLKTLQFKGASANTNDFSGLFVTHVKGRNVLLKAIETEAKAIQQHIDGDFLFNDEVNSKSFERQFEHSKILHIGTHAYLSGDKQEPTLDFGKEKVYLFELSAKKSAPSLVVLSACRTADGMIADGEGVISLSRGFNAIGTSATIAGLWNVNDEAVAQITGNFYQTLAVGKNASEALRLAKLAWLNNPETNHTMLLPYYWDSLIYMGKDQHFNLSKPFPLKVVFLSFAVLLLSSILVLKLWKR